MNHSTNYPTVHAKCLLSAGARLAEGPTWCSRRNQLIWVDILEKQIHFLDVSSGEDAVIQLDVMIGAACPIPNSDDLMLATERGFGVLRGNSGDIDWFGDPESDRPENRFNDGKFDPQGRFWAGTMRIDCEDSQSGALYRVDKDRSIHKVLDQVSLSNGLDWAQDKMYFADTPTRRVDVFEFDSDRGQISNREPLVQLDESMGFPDGLTLDPCGNLWLAQWGGSKVGHYDARSGQLLAQVKVPAKNVSSVGFGPDAMFITTAKLNPESPTEEKENCVDQGGSLFHVPLETLEKL